MNSENINSEKSVIINKIKTWLDEEKISTVDIQDVYTDFHISVKITATHSIDLFIPKDRIDSVVVAQNMNFSDDDKKGYVHLDKSRKKDFVLDLKSSLLHVGVEYAIQPDKERMQSVQVSRRIYFDGFTKDRFFDILHQVQRAMEIVYLKYETYLYHGSSDGSYLTTVFFL